MFTKIFKAIVSFIPNILSHYSVKPLEQSSELYAAIIALAGKFVVGQGWLSAANWNAWGIALLTYVFGRLFSKGLAANPAAVVKVAAVQGDGKATTA